MTDMLGSNTTIGLADLRNTGKVQSLMAKNKTIRITKRGKHLADLVVKDDIQTTASRQKYIDATWAKIENAVAQKPFTVPVNLKLDRSFFYED